jgi:hypothetical protein
MLVFPRVHDQAGNAARIVYHGIGLDGSRRFDTVSSIRRKALRILNDRGFRERARELSSTVQREELLLLDAALDSVFGGDAGATRTSERQRTSRATAANLTVNERAELSPE